MKTLKVTYRLFLIVSLTALLPFGAKAQDVVASDSIAADTTLLSSAYDEVELKADSLTMLTGKPLKVKRDWSQWKPDPKRAMWLALVCPGAGQIYNRKYWKLPLFGGGFVGCIYAYSWNNQMYQDYKQAYLDLMDSDPNTKSYESFLHLGSEITESNKSRYESLFSKRKDRFRRYRDMSFFCMLGVYALSVIDAYVDASLSQFDISDDLTLRVEPALINKGTSRNPLQDGAVGVQCSLSF